MESFAAVVAWMVVGRILILSYRRYYIARYPFLKKLMALEDLEVNEFRETIHPIVRVVLDCLFGSVTAFFWPVNIHLYRRWALARIGMYLMLRMNRYD